MDLVLEGCEDLLVGHAVILGRAGADECRRLDPALREFGFKKRAGPDFIGTPSGRATGLFVGFDHHRTSIS